MSYLGVNIPSGTNIILEVFPVYSSCLHINSNIKAFEDQKSYSCMCITNPEKSSPYTGRTTFKPYLTNAQRMHFRIPAYIYLL